MHLYVHITYTYLYDKLQFTMVTVVTSTAGISAKLRLVNLCGRGDKDMLHVAKARGVVIDTEAGQKNS